MEPNKHSILIVDDESTNLIALTHILSPDYTVRSAVNGHDAVNTAEKFLPDVILLDILLPDIDGFTVISMLKNSNKTKNIPVIFITGLDSRDDEEKGLALGAADYITKPFSSAIVKLRVRNQIKILEQLQLIQHISLTDQLTDLPNRRSFDTRFTAEWNKAGLEKSPISILVIDIDNFKRYNDSFGHQQGDVALKSFAAAFKNTLQRPSDFAARWGGEEFFALLPDTDIKNAMDIAEKVRKQAEMLEIPYDEDCDGKAAKITISIGVNTREYSDNITDSEFVLKADQALYAAKDSGRNRVCHYLDLD